MMRALVQAAFAAAAVLASTFPLYGQQSNSSIGPNVNRGGATGIGTSSTFRVVPPPQPLPPSVGSAFWYMPGTFDRPRQDEDARRQESRAPVPPPALAQEAPENPRIMITRDRIQSPQH